LRSYRAIFLDRDGVLCRNSVRKANERDQALGEIIGREDFHVTREMSMQVFWRVMEQPGIRPVNTLAREGAFWKKWYQLILEDYGVGQSSEVLATELYGRFCFHKMMELYPETHRVLKVLKAEGYKLGVISDTFPSLEASLESLGIGCYFDSFTASSLVGAGKPDPRIFEAATRSLEVVPQGCVFVDDCREEADGAREQGFTAFHLDRERQQADFDLWALGNLEHLLDFLKIG
jgi:putative hydrolase of the HAD superfamily